MNPRAIVALTESVPPRGGCRGYRSAVPIYALSRSARRRRRRRMQLYRDVYPGEFDARGVDPTTPLARRRAQHLFNLGRLAGERPSSSPPVTTGRLAAPIRSSCCASARVAWRRDWETCDVYDDSRCKSRTQTSIRRWRTGCLVVALLSAGTAAAQVPTPGETYPPGALRVPPAGLEVLAGGQCLAGGRRARRRRPISDVPACASVTYLIGSDGKTSHLHLDKVVPRGSRPGGAVHREEHPLCARSVKCRARRC